MLPPVIYRLLNCAPLYAERLWNDFYFHILLGLMLLGAISSLVLYQIFLYPSLFSPLRRIPGPPLGHLIYGQFPAIIKGEAGIPQREWVKRHGPVVRVVGPIGLERLIFVKPEALHKILVSDWIDYPRPGFMRNTLGLVAGWGLLTVTGNDHKQMRKAMNPAFSLSSLMAQMDMYYEPIESLLQILGSKVDSAPDPKYGTNLLMYEWMSKVTLDIICKTAFGYETNSLHDPHNELAEAYEHLISLQSEPMAVLVESMHQIKRISASILAERMREDSAIAGTDTEAKRDVMSLLVRARKADLADKERYAMSDKAMMEQVLTFLGAGHETTASGLAWTLWLLANDKESQSRLREEIAPLLADNPRPDYRSLKELQWLDCVVMESLRVMPPVPMSFRVANKTDYIDGVLVPKGTHFYIPVRAFLPLFNILLIVRIRSVSSILGKFCGEKMQKTGPHACIGKTMAIIEMKVVLASLIANFEFEPAYVGQVAQPTAAVTMRRIETPNWIRKSSMVLVKRSRTWANPDSAATDDAHISSETSSVVAEVEDEVVELEATKV
ncbi:hypothetical protein H0H92_007907 [Tricholoma furcatifolium]|nr:hypothetical protein H0H92_007907 [Tricholoma furcatifolium]